MERMTDLYQTINFTNEIGKGKGKKSSLKNQVMKAFRTKFHHNNDLIVQPYNTSKNAAMSNPICNFRHQGSI